MAKGHYSTLVLPAYSRPVCQRPPYRKIISNCNRESSQYGDLLLLRALWGKNYQPGSLPYSHVAIDLLTTTYIVRKPPTQQLTLQSCDGLLCDLLDGIESEDTSHQVLFAYGKVNNYGIAHAMEGNIAE